MLKFLALFCQHAVKTFGLGYCPREPIKYKSDPINSASQRLECFADAPLSTLGVVLEFALDHIDHDLVTDKPTLVHDLFGFPAEGCLFRYLRPKHITSSLNAVLLSLPALYMNEVWQYTKWQAQYLSFIFGACVPLPDAVSEETHRSVLYLFTGSWRTHQNHTDRVRVAS